MIQRVKIDNIPAVCLISMGFIVATLLLTANHLGEIAESVGRIADALEAPACEEQSP